MNKTAKIILTCAICGLALEAVFSGHDDDRKLPPHTHQEQNFESSSSGMTAVQASSTLSVGIPSPSPSEEDVTKG